MTQRVFPPPGGAGSGPALERTLLLLEFMGALERNLYTAYDGSCLRAAPTAAAAATFFHQNRKVLWHPHPHL